MDALNERVEKAIAEFPFHEFDDVADVVADSPVARETWVRDLATNVLAAQLPVAIDSAATKIEEIVVRHSKQYGVRTDLMDLLIHDLQKHLREVIKEAVAAGVIEELEY